ncbi:adenylate kinase [Rhizobium leguminosarum]|uniref:adenylate kinase n=1 Tax=Rhizobium leguminosarum TaxID=384 RepID=UPI003F96A7A0
MTRTAIVGNAGGGKSTLAREIASAFGTPHTEIDKLLWQEGWVEKPSEVYERQHATVIAENRWVIDGLGRLDLIPQRLGRATEIILIDMPLWMHFWLAAERQISWVRGDLEHTPGGLSAMPPTEALFQAIWEVEQSWMPKIRALCSEAEERGKSVTRLASVEEINAFAAKIRGE